VSSQGISGLGGTNSYGRWPSRFGNEMNTSKSAACLVERATRIFNGHDQENVLEEFGCLVRKLEIEGKVFYGIHCNDQKSLGRESWRSVAAKVKIDMGLSPETEAVQVVGDSQPYDAIGTKYNRAFLESNISQDSMILWGFTGRSWDGGQYADANGIVNDFIDANPDHWQNRCLANVVSFHTPHALRWWGQDPSHPIDGSHHVRHFWLVFNDENNVQFGDDVLSSGNLSQALMCLDGGVRSLNKFLRSLSLGQPVKVSCNARGPFHEPSCMSTRSGRPLFKNREGEIYFVEKDRGEDVVSGTIYYIRDCCDNGFFDTIISSDSVSNVYDVSKKEQRWYADFFSVGTLVIFIKGKMADYNSPAKEQQWYVDPFFVRRLIAFVKGMWTGNAPAKKELISWWNEYLKTHLPANPNIADFLTKAALLIDAREMFFRVADQFNKVEVKVCPRDTSG